MVMPNLEMRKLSPIEVTEGGPAVSAEASI